jgi:RHS repeat-associated protein
MASVVRSLVSSVVCAALVAAGLNPPQALAAPPPQPELITAANSVITLPYNGVAPRGGRTGTGLAQSEPAKVDWPVGGTAELDVPASEPAKVGRTAVSVVAPESRTPAPGRVRVEAFDHVRARELGGHGTAFQVTGGTGKVGVRVDVSGFKDAFGGDFESRLRLVAKDACALDRDAAASCRAGRPVAGHVDLTTHTLVAEVPVESGDPAKSPVFVVTAAPTSDAGSYTATPLASSSKWQVNLQSGAFSWSYPLPKVAAIAGNAPDLNLGYSSQAVDGLTAAENAQPSWVGLGWDLSTPYIERRYNGCTDDGGDTGDLCWAGDQLMLSLEGTSSELVRDTAAGGDHWRAKQDPGWRVERRRDAPGNGDDDNEYWVVTNTQGIRYTFGRGEQPTTNAKTDSVFTVPVFGDDDGEPCHKSSVEDSWCTQAWRWNLDGVEDPHGNVTTYFYAREMNRYARNGDADKSTEYVRGGHVTDITYGQRAGAQDVPAPARLHFTHEPRCVEAAGGSGTCPAFDRDHATSYPDVPLDQLCTDRCTTDDQKAPTFFTGKLLRSVNAQRVDGSSYVDVDRVDFTYSFPKPSDGTAASLWLERFRQVGLAGDGEQALPPVVFSGEEQPNRVDFDASAGVPELRKLRVTSATDELGRQVDVTYGRPHPCTRDDFPEGRADTNAQDCFPAWRTNGESSGFGWWHKYLVTRVEVTDRAGGSPTQVADYRYRGTPAWHYDDDDVTPSERKTWSDWRGYGSVDVAKLSGDRAATLTRSLFFRGMDGDRLAGGGSKDVQVVDSQGTSLDDTPWLRGKTRETQQFELDGAGNPTFELGGELHGYTSAHRTPAKPGEVDDYDDAHLVVENVGIKRTTVIAEQGGARTTRTTRLDTTHDAHGQATQVQDSVSGTTDVRCTKTTYARDDATVDRGMVALPHRSRSYAGTCAAPTQLLNGKDTYYDGSDTLGAPITRGDPTKQVDAVTASGTDTVTRTVTTTAAFDQYGRTVAETDGRGNQSRTAYDPPTGRATTVTETNALGHTEVTTTDLDRSQPVAVKDANGHTTTSTYDPLGRLTSVRMPEQAAADPPAKVFEYFLDEQHTLPPKVTTKQLQSGSTYVTTWSYLDSLGRERQKQQVSPASTDRTPKAIVTDTRYDDVGRVAATTLPVVVDVAAGSALAAVPGDRVVENRFAYDALGRVLKSAHVAKGAELWATTTAYFGDHARTTPPAGGAVSTVWNDERERLVRKEEGAGASTVATVYTYTPAGKVASITDPAGHRSTYAYDLLHRRVETADVDAGPSRIAYDDSGNVVSTWDAKALAAGGATPTLSTDYDALNRPTARWAGKSGAGTKIASFTYDTAPGGIGKQTAQTTHNGGKDYRETITGYDQRGRVTGRTWTFPGGLGGLLGDTSYSVGYGYDAADHETELTYHDATIGAPKETVATRYDALGNAKTLRGTVTDLLGHPVQVDYISDTGYAEDGKLASRDYANPLFPLRRAYSYEPDTQRLSRLQTTVTDPVLGETHVKQDDGYRWDPAGNNTAITDNTLSVATCLTYDPLVRLTHAWTTKRTDCGDSASEHTADGPAGFNKSWGYSPDGNITSVRSLGHTKRHEYGDPKHPHAVTQSGGRTYKYDANGALREKPGLLGLLGESFEWDAQHQLKSVTDTLLAKTEFVYLPDGTRVARKDPLGHATLYIDGQEIETVLGLLPKGTRYYDFAGTTVAVRLGDALGVLTWQLGDTQGSAQIKVAAGTPLPLRTYYDPYGGIRPLSAPTITDRGWLGKPKDPSTGLNALGARYYDSDLGRFISTDPANDLASAQTANAYSYGANNPITFMDPNGLWSLSGAWDWVKDKAEKAVDWVDENKGLVTNIAVGIGVGIAIGAVCATGVGCVVLAGVAAGAAGAAAGYGVDVAEGKKEASLGGFATEVGIGAVAGAVGGLAGKALAPVISKAGGAVAGALGKTAAGRAVVGTAGKVGTAFSNTVRAAERGIERGAAKVAEAAKSTAKTIARKVTGAGDDAAGPSVPYNRATHYGGAQTNSPAGQAARTAGEGQPCPSCGKTQVSGTKTAPVPEHEPSLLEHYYDHGGHAMTDAARRQYARSAEAFNGTMCLTCQRSQGAILSKLSRWYKEKWGL